MKKGFAPVLIILVIAAALVIGGLISYGIKTSYFPWQKVEAPPGSQAIAITTHASSDATSDWVTYTSPDNTFIVKHPPGLFESKTFSSPKNGNDEGVISTNNPWNGPTKNSDYFLGFALLQKQPNISLDNFISDYLKKEGSDVNANLLIPKLQKSIKVDGKDARWLEGNLGPAVIHIEVYIGRSETSVIRIEIVGGDYSLKDPITDDRRRLVEQILSTFKFTNSTSALQTYTNKSYGVSFQYPANYKVNDTLQASSLYVVPQTASLNDPNQNYQIILQSGFAINKVQVPKNSTLDSAMDYAINGGYICCAGVYNAKGLFISKEDRQIGGQQARVYKLKILGSETETNEEAYVLNGNYLYSIESNTNTNLVQTYNQILSTFKFTQ